MKMQHWTQKVQRIRYWRGALLLTLLTLPWFCLTDAAVAQEDTQRLRIGQDTRDDVMVTVYNNNYGLVREVRRASLPTGTIELEVSDVAEKIDPTSVAFKSLTAPGQVGIYEQNYRYDLLSPDTLLERFIGRPIRITTIRQEKDRDIEVSRKGTLLSLNGGRIVQFGDGEVTINPPGSISVGEVPDNLLARPTLVWLLGNQHRGEQQLEISYLTNGMNWKADYVTIINAEDTALDLTGWVTLDNHSGTAYADAQLKLIAGDVRRVREEIRLGLNARGGLASKKKATPQFEEKSFFEYHLYTLGRRTTLVNNETKQMTLLEGLDVPAKKIYAVESPPWAVQASVRGAEKRDVQVMIEFENKKEHHLGMALPAGRVRVYKADTDASLQLIGEDKIDHTPKDEKLALIVGNAFDIVAERRQSDYRKIADNVVELEYELRIRNHKAEAVTIKILEHVYGDWEILKETHPHQKRDARTIEFQVPVEPDAEATLAYRVRVRW